MRVLGWGVGTAKVRVLREGSSILIIVELVLAKGLVNPRLG